MLVLACSILMLLAMVVTTIPVFAKSTAEADPFPLSDFCTVFGVVVDASSGEPLAGVDVSKVCPPHEYLYATTNLTGNFTFDSISGVYFKLSFKKAGYQALYTPLLHISWGAEEYDMGTIYMSEKVDVQVSSQFQSLLTLLRFALVNKLSPLPVILHYTQTTTSSYVEPTSSDVSSVLESESSDVSPSVESNPTDASTAPTVTTAQPTSDTKATTDTSTSYTETPSDSTLSSTDSDTEGRSNLLTALIN